MGYETKEVINIDGNETEITVLTGTAKTYGASVTAVGTYVKYYSDFTIKLQITPL